jgi:hypothetical protein
VLLYSSLLPLLLIQVGHYFPKLTSYSIAYSLRQHGTYPFYVFHCSRFASAENETRKHIAQTPTPNP